MNDIRDLFPGRMRERAFQLKARRDTGVAWHEPQFVECKQCGRRATRQIWAKSLFVCPTRLLQKSYTLYRTRRYLLCFASNILIKTAS